MPTPALLFDIGNVLVAFDFSLATQRLAAHSPFSSDEMLDLLHEIKLPYEDGQMSDTEFIQRSIDCVQFSGSTDQFRSIWEDIFTPNQAMWDSIQNLPSEIPLYLLSNTSGIHMDYLRRSYAIFNRFRAGIYSYQVRCSKPTTQIFQITQQQLELDPARTLFIDDLPANIQTAAEQGFQVHQYRLTDHQSFQSQLDQWLCSH